MGQFDNVLEVLRYNAKCLRTEVLLGTRSAFGVTLEEAMVAQTKLDEYEKAISLLEENV